MLIYQRVPTPLKNDGVSSSVGMMTFHSQLFLESHKNHVPVTTNQFAICQLEATFWSTKCFTQLLNVSHPRRVGSRGLFFRTNVGNDQKKTCRRGIIISGGVEQEKTTSLSSYWRVLRREFSGMIHKSSLVMSSSHSPQQPIHSLLGGSSQLGSGL